LDFKKEIKRVNEVPIALFGDWDKKDNLGSISTLVLDIQWVKKRYYK